MIPDIIKKIKPFLVSQNKLLAKKAANAITSLQAKQYFNASNEKYDTLSEEAKTKLFSALKGISAKSCFEFILKGLADKSSVIRAVAVKAAIDLRDPRLIEKIIPLIKDEDAVVRKFCYQFLALFPIPKIAEELHSKLSEERDEDALIVLLEAVGEIGSPASLPTLIKMFEELHTDRVIAAIVEAIGKLKI